MQVVTEKIQMSKRARLEKRPLWIDARTDDSLLVRALHAGYTGVILTFERLEKLTPLLTDRVTCLIEVTDVSALSNAFLQKLQGTRPVVIFSKDTAVLEAAKEQGFETAFRSYIVDAGTLHDSIHIGKKYGYVVLGFKDPTNIPLELVIASLQSSNTVLVKEIESSDVDDAIVTLGVMEVGAEGILFTPKNHSILDVFLERYSKKVESEVSIEEATVLKAVPVGMGYRSCIDLTTLFSPTEGMIIGSTSQGVIFCCPEVFHLPYMELRPFRVNAGAVHSYVFNMGNQTDYMTELRAGSPVMVVDASGKTRRAYVGRVKTEVRPLRLIEVAFKTGETSNILMQDDWHVRVYSPEVKPLNITELRPGDKVLAYRTAPGRHVGIKVNENILEA